MQKMNAQSTYNLVNLVKKRWGSAALRASIRILIPNLPANYLQPATTVTVRMFNSIQDGQTFMRNFDPLLVKFQPPKQRIVDQGLSWLRKMKKDGYDGWFFSSFEVARLRVVSKKVFQLDFPPGEIVFNIEGSEFKAFREWTRM